MACPNDTYPVNLVNTSNVCDIACSLSFKYNDSSIIAKNVNGTYLSINYEITGDSKLTFKNDPYDANEIRIYMPSLHTYNGQRADAELLINHNGNNNKHLLISIPIEKKGFLSSSGITLARIVNDMAKHRINNFVDPLPITQYTLNLNSVVPEKPYFFYEGCSNNPNFFTNINVKIVAFNKTKDINSSGSIYVDDEFMKNLSALLTLPNNISTVSIQSDDLYYNMNGPQNAKKDNIYIDCQPTNEEGDVLMPMEPVKANNFLANFSKMMNNNKEMDLFRAIFGLFIMFIILWAAKTLMEVIISKFSKMNNSQNGGMIESFEL